MRLKKRVVLITGLLILLGVLIFLTYKLICNYRNECIKINLTNLTYQKNSKEKNIKKYTQDDFSDFVDDFENNKLPNIYITEFLFDGVDMYKPYDLNDFIQNGNNVNIDSLKTTVFNINTSGNIEITGKINGGMIAINTNNISKDINIALNNVDLDTNSSSIPAIYVYNRDNTYDKTKVTIDVLDDTKNYINGGSLNKVSLIAKEDLEKTAYMSLENGQSNYDLYTNYYGVYNSKEIAKILFTKDVSDDDDLNDESPYYYYSATGAISSDIDLYFTGNGYLEITSKNANGISTKGDLVLGNELGNYKIIAKNNCLNIENNKNNITVSVNSLIVNSLDNNSIDKNILSQNNLIVNNGNIIATNNAYNQVSKDSKQKSIILSFDEEINANDVIVLTDSSDKVIFAYKADKPFNNLVYSGKSLTNGTYHLYKNGEIDGTLENGLYNNIKSYKKDIQFIYFYEGIIVTDAIKENIDDIVAPLPEIQKEKIVRNPDGSISIISVDYDSDFIIEKVVNYYGKIKTYSE